MATIWPLKKKDPFGEALKGCMCLTAPATEQSWSDFSLQWDVYANPTIPLSGKAALATTAQQYAVYMQPGIQQASAGFWQALCYTIYTAEQSESLNLCNSTVSLKLPL